MTVNDYIELIFATLWLISLIGIFAFSHIHFKNVRAENFRKDALSAMQKWVGYYDKQELQNPEKADGALNDAMKELQSKGYNISGQTVKDLEALREYVLTQLRMKQAETGMNNTVKPAPEVAKNVPDKDVVQPTKPEGGVNA